MRSISAFDKMLGRNMRRARKFADVNIKQAAKALNRSAALIYYWECGVSRPPLEDLLKLAEYYQCSFLDFLEINPHLVNDSTLISQLCRLLEINRAHKSLLR